MGRPAYKAAGKDLMHWELPSCIIAEFSSPSPKRIHPFDTGAFSRGFLPNYSTIIPLDEFALSANQNVAGKYIGTFFGNNRMYYLGKSLQKNEFIRQHGILPTETSTQALLAILSGDRIAKELDERRSAIEYQFDKEISLTDGSVIATVIPEIYLEDKPFIESIENNGINVITYPIFPIYSDYYYYALYERCSAFFEKNGYFDV